MTEYKKYQLLKDIVLPGRIIPEGAIYEEYHTGRSYVNNREPYKPHFISPATIRQYPDWFKGIPPQPSSIDRIEVSMSTINFDKQVLNPYPTDSWKHAAWENGFMEAINKYIKPTPTTQPKEEDKPVLFTTEDGVEVKHGQNYWHIVSDWTPQMETAQEFGREEYQLSSLLRFSTKEAAKQYILENKPCLSANDIKWWLEKYFDYPNGINVSQLNELVKQKLNQQ